MTGHTLEVLPLSRHRWIVRYEADATPLSEHPTLAEARVAAINHARQFGEQTINVHELDGDHHVEVVQPDFRAPTPADVKGPHVEP
ncbi:MAG: hypothetical protein ACXVFG_16980 [Gaiellaceae bacterium]|jgi:hypothetical protein